MQGKFPQNFGKKILRKHGICEGILLFNFWGWKFEKILDKRNHRVIASIKYFWVSINGIWGGGGGGGGGGILNIFPDFQSDRSDQIRETTITAEMGACVGSNGSELSRARCTNPRLSPSLHWSPPNPVWLFRCFSSSLHVSVVLRLPSTENSLRQHLGVHLRPSKQQWLLRSVELRAEGNLEQLPKLLWWERAPYSSLVIMQFAVAESLLKFGCYSISRVTTRLRLLRASIQKVFSKIRLYLTMNFVVNGVEHMLLEERWNDLLTN